jgi:hypothetical protein
MADYFTRLAERTLGVTPVAQADLPSMFAPVAPMEWSMETIATRQSARAERLTPESRFQPMAREDLPPAEAEQASETPREELVFRPSLVKFQLTAREASTGHLSVAAENDNSAGARATSAAAGELSIATSRPGKAQPPRVQHGQVSIHPERAEFPDSTSFTGTRFEATSPTIQVSIGRVEVRAVTAPAQPPRVVQRKAPPLLSLDQYLRERNGGKR